MKTASWLCVILLLLSCEKETEPTPDGEDYLLQGNGKIKTLYIYSSSSETEPYATNAYTYDENWNITKILISDYPGPVFASYTFEYSDEGVLINKKYKGIEGVNYPDQTEDDFVLIRESRYSYQGDKKIVLEYQGNVLKDRVVYTIQNDLVELEEHHNVTDGSEWSVVYQYDSNKHLIKKTENPEGLYALYFYDGSRMIRSENYDNHGVLTLEYEYAYSKSDDKVIVESYNKGNYRTSLSEKTTYKDGNVMEYIRFHPTFQGEWFCHRYDYY